MFDLRFVPVQNLPAALIRAGLWAHGHAPELAIEDLGIEASDLEDERQKETQRTLEAQKKRRSIAFGAVDIDGGSESWLTDVSQALDAITASRAFWKRSGPAVLRPVAGPPRPSRPARRRIPGRDPEYMTDEQRNLLGFAGEFAAYHYLKPALPTFADEHWVSSLGRRFLGLPVKLNDDGADFHVLGLAFSSSTK